MFRIFGVLGFFLFSDLDIEDGHAVPHEENAFAIVLEDVGKHVQKHLVSSRRSSRSRRSRICSMQ